MDGLASPHGPSRDRSRPSSHTPTGRASSRASNSTTSTRMTSQSGGASSQSAASPQLSSHRFHNTPLTRPTTGIRTPQLTREGSLESRPSAVSSYLQEKLQRERRVEAEKMAPARLTPDLSSSTELRAVQSPPMRTPTTEGGPRPVSRSNSGALVAEQAKKKGGMGLKEMENNVSTLHKQNFDLKLQLFHHREAQTRLEQRVTAAEEENRQLQDMNEEVLEELQKRDKAVEEAVAMIVLLEAQVERLVKEVGVLREAGARDFYRRISHELDVTGRSSTPNKFRSADPTRLDGGEGHPLNRMPSFVSVHSDRTENLRNVYLNSLTSLPRPFESQSELDNDRSTALASPSLSVLSESSFVSVYGRKTQGQDSSNAGSPPNQRLSMDSLDGDASPPNIPTSKGSRHSQSRDVMATPPSRPQRSNSITNGTAPGHFQSLENILDQASPLQRLVKMDRTMSLNADSSRQWAHERELDQHQLTRSTKTLSHRKTKEEKREALRRVMTNDASSRLHDHGLPPTPDTISTSTLRHYKNSNDTLSQQGMTSQRSYVALSETPSGNDDRYNMEVAAPNPVVPVSQPPSMTAFNSRKDTGGRSYFDNRIPVTQQRPRSAGETTTSRHGGNDWDADSDEESDARSVESSLDIWMREGRKPGRARESGRAASPDLFGFPTRTATGTWTTPTFRPFVSGLDVGPDDQLLPSQNPDEVVPVQAAILAAGGGPPPPPNRRSSLHARTGSTSASAMLNAMQQQGRPSVVMASSSTTTRRDKSPSRRRRRAHARRNSDDMPSLRVASQPMQLLPQTSDSGNNNNNNQGGGSRPKDSHYPPITGQQQAPRGRGLNRLFRRSLGSSSGGVTESAPGSATEATFEAAAAAAAAGGGGSTSKTGSIGIPSWMHRANTGDDERSVTPPPIMRNRLVSGMDDGGGAPTPPTPKAHGGRGEAGGGGGWGHAAPSTPTAPPPHSAKQPAGMPTTAPTSSTPTTTTPADGGSTRRKWLPGFGRSSNSTKNRAG